MKRSLLILLGSIGGGPRRLSSAMLQASRANPTVLALCPAARVTLGQLLRRRYLSETRHEEGSQKETAHPKRQQVRLLVKAVRKEGERFKDCTIVLS
jgi:hypothetical protein